MRVPPTWSVLLDKYARWPTRSTAHPFAWVGTEDAGALTAAGCALSFADIGDPSGAVTANTRYATMSKVAATTPITNQPFCACVHARGVGGRPVGKAEAAAAEASIGRSDAGSAAGSGDSAGVA